MDSVDVVVIGAGPAGAVAALNLAPTRHVVLVERRVDGLQRTGEALPPVARRLFADMGLLTEFLAEDHLPCYGNRSVYYSYNEQPKRTFWQKHRDKLTVAAGAGTGALVGGLIGGKKGAGIGLLGGGAGSALYTYKLRHKHRRY